MAGKEKGKPEMHFKVDASAATAEKRGASRVYKSMLCSTGGGVMDSNILP